METKRILEADYLDLIFDKRNKAYGSYELRKNYNRRALKALGITLAVIAGGILTPFVVSELHAKTPTEMKPAERMVPDITLHDIEPPQPPKPPVAPPPPPDPPGPAPVVPSVKNLPSVIVPPEQVKPEDTPPTADELKDKLSAAANNPGTPDGTALALNADKTEGKGHGEPAVSGTGGGKDKHGDDPFVSVEQMPEFPGGQQALMAFIKKNLRYPQRAIDAELQGKVFVRFVVNAQGGIESAAIIRGIGGGCNEEALRVVNAMPQWKPGKQNGQAVKVYYTLPISFKLM